MVTADDVEPTSAQWSLLLFENERIGLAAGLTFGLTIACRALADDPVSVTVDWIPFDGFTRHELAGTVFTAEEFGEGAEASICFDGMHHRFDYVNLRVIGQRGSTIDYRLSISGDVDELGIDELALTGSADFAGLTYHLSDPGRAAEFLDIDGL